MRGHNVVDGVLRMLRPGQSPIGLKRTTSEVSVARNAYMRPQLAAQARVAVAIVKELQQSLLILDEVDLILHPLKSELNWPLGARAPLDFTAATNPTGLRWRVPYLLLVEHGRLR